MLMLKAIAPTNRGRLSLLFEGSVGLRGVVDAVLEGAMGEAWADDPVAPRVGVMKLDFYLMAGDLASPAIREAVGLLSAGDHVLAPESWVGLLEDCGEPVTAYERVEFHVGRWDIAVLRERQALPQGMTLVLVDGGNVAAFARLAESLVYNFESLEDFVERGVGFGVVEEGRFIAGCSSYAVSSRMLEFEVQTHPDYERRGLATATASRMIEYCLEAGLEPRWDAAHEGSARLAARLGFVEPRAYTAYRVR